MLAAVAHAGSPDGNRLSYLDGSDPFHPHLGLAKFTTPQWIGEEGVEAVVIIAIDDLKEPGKYETYLRPVLERLKQIDGRAPASIMCNQLALEDPQFQTWLAAGVSLEVHTLTHPCPLLGKAGLAEAQRSYHGGVDLLGRIPGNAPVAFRMPCCDSMNSASPRFFAEIFSQRSSEGRALAIDSSVMCLLTPRDSTLPRELVLDADGAERFRKYFPMEMRPPRKLTFERFAGYIEDYPYPYVIGRSGWEFPCMVPSDWEAFNAHGAKNPRTTEDWKAALDAVVLKQGVMAMVVHPHGWSDPQQLVELIDHAVAKHGKRVKFLNFREALERLEKHALAGESLRGKDTADNGVRLLDLNADGFMDVVIGNAQRQITRVWNPTEGKWRDSALPFPVSEVSFGVLEGQTVAVRSGSAAAAWKFTKEGWQKAPALLEGLPASDTKTAVQFRDIDQDGHCEALISTPGTTSIFSFSPKAQRWEAAPFALPEDVALLNDRGEDNGLRFVDLNDDGHDDVLLSNEERYAIHLWTKTVRPELGWSAGWSQLIRAGNRTGAAKEPPPIVRAGPHRNNGAWFRNGHMVVQNEDTASMEAVVDWRSFKELIAFDIPAAKSPEESLAALKLRPGFTAELVATEPLIVDPVAFEWDARGRLWVVEMRDYPLGMDETGKPGGVIKVLEDTDGDGRYDKATTFLEGIPFPTGVMPWRNGVLVCAAPELYYAEDTDGDGKADQREVLFTGFTPGNQQHRFNGLEWGLDGWIYGANGDSGGQVKSLRTGQAISISGRDFRFCPDTGEIEAESGATQYGRRRDDWGEWFGNNNPTWLWHYTISDRYLRRNPKLAVTSVRKVLANYDAPTRVFPVSEQPIRFNQPQSLGHVTSACSPSPYRDDLFGPGFANSVFVSEPVHNAVHRENLTPEGATFTSQRADDESDSEFLASRDVWFRPTMLKTGPDGALYIADMYRFVLEHPEWIAPETQARLDLRAGEDKGRIYRVAPVDAKRRPIPHLATLQPAALVTALDSPNGWQRDTAQRLLVERNDPTAIPALEELARSAANPKVRLQALATLDVLQAAKPATVSAALRDPDPLVRVHALRVSERVTTDSDALLDSTIALAADPDFRVRRQLAFTLGEFRGEKAEAALARLATREGADAQMRVAILSSVPPTSPLMKTLAERPAEKRATSSAPAITASTPDRAKVVESFKAAASAPGDPARGREVFRQICAACHRFKGDGRELGPDLAMVASKPADWLLTAIFDPNQAVEPRYQAQHVTLLDNSSVLGLIASETANNITLRIADGTERAVLRSDLREIRPLGQSLMPEGLETLLTKEDVANLLTYLRQP